MVWQREALGYDYKRVAHNLGVDKATVCRAMALFHTTGHVRKKPYPTEKTNRKLTIPGQLLVMQLVLNNPGIYLHEIQNKLAEVLMLEVSIATIFQCLKANGFTRQKLQTTAIQQDEYLRQQYVQDIISLFIRHANFC